MSYPENTKLIFSKLTAWMHFKNVTALKPNTHRRRDETVLSLRVGVGGVYGLKKAPSSR